MQMIDDEKNAGSGEDSNSYAKNIVIGLGLAALYFAPRTWLSEGAFFCIAITVFLFYNVIAPFRNYWAKPRLWAALVVLFGGHATLLWYFAPRAWSFWAFMKLGVPEGLAMILILGWILGDNYFTRNTRRQRAQAAAHERKKEEWAAPKPPSRR
jgi:hypothetical protein